MQPEHESSTTEDDYRIAEWEHEVDGWSITVDRVFYDEEYNAWHLIARMHADELGPWRAHVDLEVHPDGMELIELTFRLEQGAKDRRGKLLKRLRYGSAIATIAKVAKSMPVPEGVDPARWHVIVPRPGRSGYPREFYVDWVERHRKAKANYGRNYWAQLLAENPGYKQAQIRKILDRAAAMGVE